MNTIIAGADFTKKVGKLNPALHSSGWAPRSSTRVIQNDDEAVKAMNFRYARTLDWALVNAGQRVVDYQYIFPLFGMNQDYFREILQACKDAGVDPEDAETIHFPLSTFHSSHAPVYKTPARRSGTNKSRSLAYALEWFGKLTFEVLAKVRQLVSRASNPWQYALPAADILRRQPITLGHNAQSLLLVSQRLALHIAQD